ncbi:molybdenum cofactor guanylyltransferase [Actinopolyspora mortivallis]|uniref:Molybdopterin-guanine dinucleotide biosynthesis protein MobA n=1 Tax=Actinopolyspora mortivallis TaxID=33906 RepID=A0A2T0GXA0_ACTMO|nr:NTP transferase domain-containing protein [Actinopolyspora mortivallis]PRW63738.1 molybdopterin-guanine dinucleotide biosynthesis protein MobA [Actinopolyspora mortivallis]
MGASRAGFAGIVLAGGRATRLGGRDKPGLVLWGRSLLDRTLDAVAGADPVVVVGPSRPVSREVRWTREHPVGGGPVAALAAGLEALTERVELIAVLAADHPWLTDRTLARLRRCLRAEAGAAGAVLVDDDGARQWLVGVWRARELRAAVPVRPEGHALRRVLSPLSPVPVPARWAEVTDVDTPEDLARADSWVWGPSSGT